MNSSDDGPPGCPARQGQGTSIGAADFTLVVHDCDTGPDGRAATTEVFGYFRLPGEEHDNDSLETASIVMPALSPSPAWCISPALTAFSPAGQPPGSAAM